MDLIDELRIQTEIAKKQQELETLTPYCAKKKLMDAAKDGKLCTILH